METKIIAYTYCVIMKDGKPRWQKLTPDAYSDYSVLYMGNEPVKASDHEVGTTFTVTHTYVVQGPNRPTFEFGDDS